MNSLDFIIIMTTAFFALGIVVQSLTRLKFCAVCVAISLSWVTLLTMKLGGFAVSPTIIGILMGESVVGMYFFLEKRVPEALQLFRWPYLITATVVVLWVAGEQRGGKRALLLLLFIWITYVLIFMFRNNIYFKKITERLLACCRDW